MEPAGKEPRLPGSARTPKARGQCGRRGPNGTGVRAGVAGGKLCSAARGALSDGGAGLGARELGARARSCTWH